LLMSSTQSFMVLLLPAKNSNCYCSLPFLNSIWKLDIFPGTGAHLNPVACLLVIFYLVTLLLLLSDLTSLSVRKGMSPSGSLLT
jgi:hypothetical protein